MVDSVPEVGKHPTIKADQYQQKAGAYGDVKRSKKLPQKLVMSGLPSGVLGAPVSFERMGNKDESSNSKLRATPGAKPVGAVAAEIFVSEALEVSGEGASGDHLTPRKQPDFG